jgi:hypothetical protein
MDVLLPGIVGSRQGRSAARQRLLAMPQAPGRRGRLAYDPAMTSMKFPAQPARAREAHTATRLDPPAARGAQARSPARRPPADDRALPVIAKATI